MKHNGHGMQNKHGYLSFVLSNSDDRQIDCLSPDGWTSLEPKCEFPSKRIVNQPDDT